MSDCISYLFYYIKRDAPLIGIFIWFLLSVILIVFGLVYAVALGELLGLVVAGVGCLVNPFTVLRLLVRFYILQSKYGECKKKQVNENISSYQETEKGDKTK